MDFFFCMSLIVLALVACITVEGVLGGRRIRGLNEIKPQKNRITPLPLVSIIIPALNEAENIEAALASVLALNYPSLEIIVLNDRSTDATPAILDRMAVRDARLRIIHIDTLPSGWLGKTHALHVGAQQAHGDYLLFTDADVHLASDTVDRAISRMEEVELDHLCLIFRPVLPNTLLAMLVVDSLAGLLSFLKPWLAADPNSRFFFGIGAFNLVRARTYQRLGGHETIRLCPVDDILLGRIIKENGGCQECLNGREFITVPWYDSVGEMIRGLHKNLFSALDYRFERLVLATLLILGCTILPFWGLLFADNATRLICGLIIVVTGFSQSLAARALGVPLSCLRWFLLTPYVKLYMMWQAVFVTLFRGGIEWRGTFYPLDELKQNMVPLWPWHK